MMTIRSILRFIYVLLLFRFRFFAYFVLFVTTNDTTRLAAFSVGQRTRRVLDKLKSVVLPQKLRTRLWAGWLSVNSCCCRRDGDSPPQNRFRASRETRRDTISVFFYNRHTLDKRERVIVRLTPLLLLLALFIVVVATTRTTV